MAVIPILLSDSRTQVDYKVRLARLASERAAEIEAVQKYRAYYRGEHKLLLSDDQKDFLDGVISEDGDYPIDNKCRTVVRKIRGRLNVIGLRDSHGNKVFFEEAEGEPEDQGTGQRRTAATGIGAQGGGGGAGGADVGGGGAAGVGGRAAGEGEGGAGAARVGEGARAGAGGVRGGPGGQAGSQTLEAAVGWWVDNQMDFWEGQVYSAALRDEDAFLIVSHDGEKPVFTFAEKWDGSTGIYMIYEDPQTKQRPILAIKYWWSVDPMNIDPLVSTGLTAAETFQGAGYVLRATVYTRDRVFKYARFHNDRQLGFYKVVGKKTEDEFWPIQDTTDTAWPLPWVDAQGQPLGLAVVPFTTPDGSVIDGIVGLQDALNKTNLDVLANADQMGFGVIAVEYDQLPTVVDETDDPSAAADGLGLRPGRVLETTGAVTKLAADDNAGLLATARHWVEGIAANSDVPFYEFMPTVGEVPSGAALQMLDSSLSERADECIVAFTPKWREALTLAQKLDALYGDGNGQIERVTPIWKDTTRRTIDAELAKLDLERRQLNLEMDRQSHAERQQLVAAGGNEGIANRLRAGIGGRQPGGAA